MTPQEATNKLFEAAKTGNVSDAEAALAAGADPNARDDLQRTPLHWATMNGYGQTDLARLLLDKGTDVNAKTGSRQLTPLHFAVTYSYTDLARMLIEKGADPNAKNDYGMTPLDWAAIDGHTDLVKLLQGAAKQQPGHAGRVAKRRASSGEPQIGG